MYIRKAVIDDLDDLDMVYERARNFMRSYGNDQQWTNGYPDSSILTDDINSDQLYVLIDDDVIQAAFVFYIGEDPCYKEIYDGNWLNDETYGVIHRIATRGLKRHMCDIVLDYCFSKINNIRIDTHELNMPMQKFLYRHGFVHVGTIYLNNGESRLAFHCNLKKN